MSRKAVALLITLAFVTAITGLIGIMAGIFENALFDVSKKKLIVQSNVLFKDIKQILKDNVSDINGSEELDFLLSFPLEASDDENDVSVAATFSSGSSVVNINKMIDVNQTVNQDYVDSLNFAFVEYGVIDRPFFIDIILDSIDADKEERSFGSEIALEERFFRNGRIENYEHFQKIIDYYKAKREDISVEKIPWKEIIGFDNEKIDFNYASVDALWFILRKYDKSFLKKIYEDKIEPYDSFDKLFFDEDDKKKLQAFKVEFFSPEVICATKFRQGKEETNMVFSYNLKTKEVSNIEFSY